MRSTRTTTSWSNIRASKSYRSSRVYSLIPTLLPAGEGSILLPFFIGIGEGSIDLLFFVCERRSFVLPSPPGRGVKGEGRFIGGDGRRNEVAESSINRRPAEHRPLFLELRQRARARRHHAGTSA